jgi:hypothetical protein
MKTQRSIPSPSGDQRLLSNLRHARIEMEELGLELDEVLARLNKEIRHQRLKRILKSQSVQVRL